MTTSEPIFDSVYECYSEKKKYPVIETWFGEFFNYLNGFQLNYFQRELYCAYCNGQCISICSPRQVGISTLIDTILLYGCVYGQMSGTIVVNAHNAALERINKLRLLSAKLEAGGHLRVDIKNNSHSIEFHGGDLRVISDPDILRTPRRCNTLILDNVDSEHWKESIMETSATIISHPSGHVVEFKTQDKIYERD